MPTQVSRAKVIQELERLKNAIIIKLERYYKKNIKGSGFPVDVIRQDDKEVRQIIRETVQESWLYASGIIGTASGQTVNITTADIQGIEATTNEMTDMFWTTADKNLRRETEFKVDENSQLQSLEPFTLHAAMVGLGGWFVYFAYNESIENKSNEVGGIKLRFVTRNDPRVDPIQCKPLHGKIYNVGEAPHPPLHRHCRCVLIPVVV